MIVSHYTYVQFQILLLLEFDNARLHVLSVPFDRTTIAGFYALLTAQFIASAFYLALYTAALALHIGYTVYIQAFVFDIQAMLDGIDATAERKLRAIDLIDIVRLHDLATQLGLPAENLCFIYPFSIK